MAVGFSYGCFCFFFALFGFCVTDYTWQFIFARFCPASYCSPAFVLIS